MTVVPGVIIHQRGSVGHPCYLVAVVPPRHDARVLVRVLSQPIVGLPEVVQDVACPGKEGEGWQVTALTGNQPPSQLINISVTTMNQESKMAKNRAAMQEKRGNVKPTPKTAPP